MARNVEERREPCPEPAPLEGQPLGPADNKPSQAEGDRETVEEDLHLKDSELERLRREHGDRERGGREHGDR